MSTLFGNDFQLNAPQKKYSNKEIIYDTNVANYVLGYLMINPRRLVSGNLLLDLEDFQKSSQKIIFGAIRNLSIAGAKKITTIDIGNYLKGSFPETEQRFTSEGGLELLQKIEQSHFNDNGQFELHYNRLKKFTILRNLYDQGIDIRELYNYESILKEQECKKLDNIDISDITDFFRKKIDTIERNHYSKDGDYFQEASENLDDLIERLKESPDYGANMDGDILNAASRGARSGKMYLFSAGSGGGKTRFFVSQACYRAFPRIETGGKVVIPDELGKVYYMATEQEPEEIQTMILAYISGVDEEKIHNMTLLTEEESNRIDVACKILKEYSSNFYIDRMPEPSISKVKNKIIQQIEERNVEMVVYDYLATPDDDEGLSTKRNLRNDQILLQFSNMLKEIAVSYDVFVLTGTQITGGDVSKKLFRGFADIRDSKSIADKADFCMIGCRISQEEEERVSTFWREGKFPKPNYVIDIYKNRAGKMVNSKIFRKFDLGTLRSIDCFAVRASDFNLDNYNSNIKVGSQKVVDMLDFLTTRR